MHLLLLFGKMGSVLPCQRKPCEEGGAEREGILVDIKFGVVVGVAYRAIRFGADEKVHGGDQIGVAGKVLTAWGYGGVAAYLFGGNHGRCHGGEAVV